jgi:hypothetical protein
MTRLSAVSARFGAQFELAEEQKVASAGRAGPFALYRLVRMQSGQRER